jgi:hypothetical protein
MSLTAADILGIQDRKVKRVDVPEWGEGAHVFLRSLSLAEALAVNDASKNIEDSSTLAEMQLAAFLGDENGNALFQDAAAAKGLASRSARVLNRLIDEAQKLNSSGSVEAEKQK